MREVLAYLEERRSEFERHLFIARLLEARVNDAASDETAQVEVRHVNTVKSGLLIHLYNIVEAIAVRTMEEVGRTVVSEKPKRWTDAVRKEWVRSSIWDGEERIGDGAMNRLVDISAVLASGGAPSAFKVRSEPGSWDDAAIKKIAERLGCRLVLSDDIRRAAYEPVYRNETTAMKYLASRRNAIAHGAATFEEGANDHTLDEIEKLGGRILPYLREVSQSYESFLDGQAYLKPTEEAA